MRIIGGEAKGRPIHVPRDSAIRPTSSRIKEALFAMLTPDSSTKFLDLFAGSGSIGLEALSRGAGRVVFVENDIRLVATLKESLTSCGFVDRHEILTFEVKQCLRLFAAQQRRFDIVFADPPYGKGLVGETLRYLHAADIVSPDGVIVIQHSTRETGEGLDGSAFTVTHQKRYGDTLLSLLEVTIKADGDI